MNNESFFKTELSHLKDLVNTFYTAADTDELSQVVEFAFKEGLREARFWVDTGLNYTAQNEADENFNGNLLKTRRKGMDEHSFAGLFDTLFILDDWVSRCTNELHRHLTTYPKWNYSSEANKVYAKARKQFNLDGLSLIEMDSKDESAAVKGYKGENGGGCGSLPMPELLSTYQSTYSVEEQGFNLDDWMIRNVYGHGLFCAKLYNSKSLVSALTPIYKKQLNAEIQCDNGDEILEAIKGNEFIDLMQTLRPIKFKSTEDLEKTIASVKEAKHVSENNEEEKRKRVKKRLNDIAEKVKKPDLTREEKEKIREGVIDGVLADRRALRGEFL